MIKKIPRRFNTLREPTPILTVIIPFAKQLKSFTKPNMYSSLYNIKKTAPIATISKVNLPAYDKTVEVTSYVDGEILIWDASTATNVCFAAPEVSKLRKLLQDMESFASNKFKSTEKAVLLITKAIDAPTVIKEVKAPKATAPKAPTSVKGKPKSGTSPAKATASAALPNPAKKMGAEARTGTITGTITVDNTITNTVASLGTNAMLYSGLAPSFKKGVSKEVLSKDSSVYPYVWGANVLLGVEPLKIGRYYYHTRDQARLADEVHTVGDASGRLY